ncbi:MAG: HAMP domain-containing protein [Gammaproteobacteria bacterium]|jgi:two-component system sensor histidine kinase GlrK|nr:HAMP domain-containing protein [Gammaproteobacteria bacterium]
MRLYRPKSIRRLLLIGFVLVVVPLMVALIYAMYSVDQLVDQGQQALFATVRTTHGSEQLADAITDMERNARQYKVLGDAALLEVYHENHQKFLDTAKQLAVLNLSDKQRERLDKIVKVEGVINDALISTPHDAPETAAVVEDFSRLARDARKMLVDNRKLVEQEVEWLDANGARVQRGLVVQAMALVPGAMILSGIFTILITRPIRQVDMAIRRLGEGDFSKPAHIVGPRDLEQLGERLDWMRTRLLEVEQDKNRFLQRISHELKTPLTAIREGSELLNEEVVGSLNAQQAEIVAILKNNTLQLQKLIEDLLDYNMASSRGSQLHIEQVDLRPLILSVLEDHKFATLARQLLLETDLQPVKLDGDRAKLRTLVDNLVSNAVKFSPEQGCLRIRLEERNEQAILEVADSGPGIPVEERRRVFDAFYQGSSTAIVHARGTGLGLSIAREYAQAHDGYIEVIDSEGTGACVRVVLPIEKSEVMSA